MIYNYFNYRLIT